MKIGILLQPVKLGFNMKKVFLTILLVLITVLFSSCKTFNGYYSNIDEVRNSNSCYSQSDYLFTKELDDVIIDFVIKNNTIYINEIEKKATSKTTFKIKHTASYLVSESIDLFEQNQQYNWTNSSKISIVDFKWCITTLKYNEENQKYNSFEFNYNDAKYCLCYQIN